MYTYAYAYASCNLEVLFSIVENGTYTHMCVYIYMYAYLCVARDLEVLYNSLW